RIHVHHQVPQHRVAEAEGTGQLIESLLVRLDVHEHVVCLVDLGDRVGELPPSPVLETMHVTATGGDHALVALDHRGHLLALIRVHKENDFVMPHECSFWVKPPDSRHTPVRQGESAGGTAPPTSLRKKGREGYSNRDGTATSARAPPLADQGL